MPKQQTSKALNAWQQERCNAVNVDDATLQADIDRMIERGVLPKNLTPYTMKMIDAETYIGKIWFDRTIRKWKLERISKRDGSVLRLEGTLDEIGLVLLQARGELEAERQQAEADDPANWDEESQEVWKWLRNTIHGQEYNSIKCEATWQMMQAELKRLRLPLCAEHLEKAYCNIADREENNFERFFAKANRIAAERRAEQEATEPQKLDCGEFSARTPFINLPTQDAARKAEDVANRAKPLAQLRREALFGGKVLTVPVTGTAPRR